MRRVAVVMLSLALAPLGARAISVEEVQSVYRAELLNAPAGVHESGEYIFVIQEGPDDSAVEAAGGINAVTLKGQRDALREYIGRPAGENVSPFSADLTAQLVAVAETPIPEHESCRVDQLRAYGRFRHVTAHEAAPLRAARAEAQRGLPVVRSVDDWAALLSRKLNALGTQANRERLLVALGAVETLVTKYGGAAWRLDGVDAVAAARLARDWRGDEDRVRAFAALRINPAFAPAHRRLAELYQADGDWVKALSRRLKSAADPPRPDAVELVGAAVASNFQAQAWTEYARLYRRALGEAQVFRRGGEIAFFEYELNTFGHLEHAAGVRSQAAAAKFNEAATLFAAGKELPKILELLKSVLAESPDCADAWRYFGAALKADGQPHDALIAFNQALTLKPGDPLALVNLCLLYDQLDCDALAIGCAWTICADAPDAPNRDKVKAVLKKRLGTTVAP